MATSSAHALPPIDDDACPPESGPREGLRLRASNGASCSVARTVEGERILVRDAEDRVVVSFDPVTGKATITAPGGIAFRTDGDIDLQAKGHVRLGGKTLGVAAERADLTIANTKFRGLSVDVAAEEIRHVAARVEAIAGSLLSRAKQVFRTVEDTEHATIGRQRTVVKTSYRLEAGHAAIRADEEVKIDGEHIYLG